jgi:hypothetical protein
MTSTKTLIIGLIVSILACISVWHQVFGQAISIFPLGWMGAGLTYMSIFFHEIGHTVTAWFYGYPTVPMFDFEHGGGLAVWFSDSIFLIVVCVWGLFGYGILVFRDYKIVQLVLGALLLFNFATFWNEDWHRSVIDFMGPAFEALVAGFFLFRAIFNLAPRGDFERILNAVFGFGMIFRIFIDGYGLLHNQEHRLSYYQQKGMHGFGDFDKIADSLGLGFDSVVYAWGFLGVACLTVPFVLLLFRSST